MSRDSRSSAEKIAGILALISVFLTGILYVTTLVMSMLAHAGVITGTNAVTGAMQLVANIFLLAAVIIISWRALARLRVDDSVKRVLIIIYWIMVALSIAGVAGMGYFSIVA